ncbi:MAG: TIGR00730 family Rossman fold protein [Calditrichaeota bacterium]|nr:MAG: TIGR00730 family Rossman fold protein [Calditrichota bacterium]
MHRTICVFAASSNRMDPAYFTTAHQLGVEIARRGYELIFGGGEIGLMGAVAAAVKKHGGRVVGVIPEALRLPGIAYEEADELIVTPTMHQRKAIMIERADAFLVLPGSFGTLEEALEVLTLKQLGYHNKPVVFLNLRQFYQPLIHLFEHLYREQAAREDHRKLYFFASEIEDAFTYLDGYRPIEFQHKWT